MSALGREPPLFRGIKVNNPESAPGARATANKYGRTGALIGLGLGLVAGVASGLWGDPAGAYRGEARAQIMIANSIGWVLYGAFGLGIPAYIAGLIRGRNR
jgi:hypothetical protein